MNSDKPGSMGFAVRSLAHDIRKMLREKLMRNFEIPAGFLKKSLSVRDKLNERESGYYFGQGAEAKRMFNGWAENFAGHLAKGEKQVIQLQRTDNKNEWRPTHHASEWLRMADELTLLLFLLVHLCGGGPPRVTEMIEAKVRNTAGSRRNLYIVKNRVALIGSYSKTSKQLEKGKPIAIFFDENTSEFLLLFTICIKPVQCFVLKSSVLALRATEDYLFCRSGEKVSENVIRTAFSKELSARGIPFNASLYRQYRAGVAKAYLSQMSHNRHEQLLFLQAGHTEATARVRYAGGDFNVGDLSMAKIEGFFNISQQWHELLGIGDAKVHVQENMTVSKVATKSIPSSAPKRVRKDNIEPTPSKQRRVDSDVAHKDKTLCDPSEVLAESLQCAVRKVLHVTELEQVKYKSEAQRSAVYECAMHTIMRGYRSSMIVILPTGGGKTLCWAAPAYREQRLSDELSRRPPITVLIVPLIALQQDMIRKCEQYGLICASWTNRFNEGITVVVCSVDNVFSNEYQRFVTALAMQRQISRLVIDEAHVLLLWEELRKFGNIGERLRTTITQEVPLVCMSATLPNELVSALQQLLRLDSSCLKLYRAINTRPNIHYEMRELKSRRIEEIIRECAKLMNEELTGMNRKDRAIVFCLSIADCTMLLEKFNELYENQAACVYHGSMDQNERRLNFETWMSDSNVRLS